MKTLTAKEYFSEGGGYPIYDEYLIERIQEYSNYLANKVAEQALKDAAENVQLIWSYDKPETGDYRISECLNKYIYVDKQSITKTQFELP